MIDERTVQGIITDIQRFSVHDGQGIRTVIFLKGCPLRCLWCHNPETNRSCVEMAYYRDKCIGCGQCLRVCPSGAIAEEGAVARYGAHSAACAPMLAAPEPEFGSGSKRRQESF